MTGLFSISCMGYIILPIDELIFFRGVKITNQINIHKRHDFHLFPWDVPQKNRGMSQAMTFLGASLSPSLQGGGWVFERSRFLGKYEYRDNMNELVLGIYICREGIIVYNYPILYLLILGYFRWGDFFLTN